MTSPYLTYRRHSPVFYSILLYGQPILSHYQFRNKNIKCTQSDLGQYKVSNTHIGYTSIHRAQISVRFVLLQSLFQIITIFFFPYTIKCKMLILNDFGQSKPNLISPPIPTGNTMMKLCTATTITTGSPPTPTPPPPPLLPLY